MKAFWADVVCFCIVSAYCMLGNTYLFYKFFYDKYFVEAKNLYSCNKLEVGTHEWLSQMDLENESYV